MWRKKWVRVTALVAIIPVVALCFAAGYYYVSFARLIDQRLQGARLLGAPARLRAAARAPPRPVADRSPARRSVERPRLRATAERGQAGRIRRRKRGGIDPTATRAVQGRARARRVSTAGAASPETGGPDTAAGASGPRAANRDREEGHRTDHARRSGPGGAHRRRARKAPAGCVDGDSPACGSGGACDRGSPLLLPPGSRSDPARRRDRREPHQRHRTDRGHQHDHAAAGQKCLPAAVRRLDAAERPRAERPAQAARAVSRARARHARVEGRDPRNVSERHAARAARVVRHFRGCRGRPAVLRQGRQQRLAGRSGDHGRRAAVALVSFAVQQPGPVQRASQRRHPGDGRCRFHHGGGSLRRVTGATRRRSAGARS